MDWNDGDTPKGSTHEKPLPLAKTLHEMEQDERASPHLAAAAPSRIFGGALISPSKRFFFVP